MKITDFKRTLKNSGHRINIHSAFRHHLILEGGIKHKIAMLHWAQKMITKQLPYTTCVQLKCGHIFDACDILNNLHVEFHCSQPESDVVRKHDSCDVCQIFKLEKVKV